MSWRIRVEHHSLYRYSGVVDSSYNEARITPMSTPTQLVLDSSVEISPPARAYRYLDYWGSVVHAFDVQKPHRELAVVGRSVVETMATRLGAFAPAPEMSWPELGDGKVRDEFAEVLAATTQVPVDARLATVGASLQASNDPASAGIAAMEWVRDELTYVAGTTGVHTSAIEAWEGGQGVCQDFALLGLALVRAMGIPARYCSGYLHPDAEADLGSTIDGQSHAWLEIWTGDWRALDPTAGGPIGDGHVLVARGRDYNDVPPLKGIFHGGPASSLDVTVRLTRLG